MKGSFQISLICILFILLGFCITELHWNYRWSYHSTLTLCNCTTRSDLNSLNGHYRSKYGQNYDIVTGTRNSSNPRICKYRYGRQRLSFNQLRVFNYRGLFDRESLSETHGSKSDTQEANGTQNGLPHGLLQSPPKEELGAFVIQLDTAHWQHELQILSAMSTNKDLKVSASGTMSGKRIIRPLDSTTHLWLQSCTCISQKPVKFIQLIKKSVVTAVMQNVHLFISMEALLADQRINTAERILSYNSSTKDMEPTRSVKVTLNMKTVPAELRINFIGIFYVRPYVTKPIR